MFFVFPFLLLSIYFSETNNFVLKKDSQGQHFKQYGKDPIFQDLQNDSFIFPTRKSILHIIQNLTKTKSRNPGLNHFNKTLSVVVPIKRHIQDNNEEDTPSFNKKSKSNIATSTRELKRKWPVVELLTHSDDLNENSQYVDDTEQKEIPYLHDIEKEFKVREFTPKYISSYVDLHNNHSKDKPIGLRSLPQRKYSGINCEDRDQCICRLPETQRPPTTTRTTTTQPCNSQFDIGFQMGIPVGVPMGVPMGVPAGYAPGIPVGYPGGFPVGFPASCPSANSRPPMPFVPSSPPCYQADTCKKVCKHNKPCKTHSNDYLYYEDDDNDDDELENNCDYEEDSFGKKIRYKKQRKGDILINVEYGMEEKRARKTTQSSKCRHNHEDFSNFFNDRKFIGESYCTASSCSINYQLVFLLLILVTFFKLLSSY